MLRCRPFHVLALGAFMALGPERRDLRASEKTPTSDPVICFKHMGTSDKPIFPIIISARRQTESELRVLVSSSDPQPPVELVEPLDRVLSYATLIRKLCARRERQEKSTALPPFGTFSVLLMDRGSVTSATVTRPEARALFKEIVGLSKGADAKLLEQFRGLIHRLADAKERNR